jgi:hypothetical protein
MRTGVIGVLASGRDRGTRVHHHLEPMPARQAQHAAELDIVERGPRVSVAVVEQMRERSAQVAAEPRAGVDDLRVCLAAHAAAGERHVAVLDVRILDADGGFAGGAVEEREHGR